MITYLQAAVIGAVQGVTELFPISSLGHSVLVADWVGGSWKQVTVGRSGRGATYLAFVVALHVATAIALLGYYWRDWLAIIAGFLATLRTRRAETVPQRLAWLIVLATLPVAVLGPFLDRPLHALFTTPVDTSVFLTLNGVVLVIGEGLRRRNEPTLAEYGRRFGRHEAHRSVHPAGPKHTQAQDRRISGGPGRSWDCPAEHENCRSRANICGVPCPDRSSTVPWCLCSEVGNELERFESSPLPVSAVRLGGRAACRECNAPVVFEDWQLISYLISLLGVRVLLLLGRRLNQRFVQRPGARLRWVVGRCSDHG
ncbi:undecaprenyl-diphosphate phosphatase [Nocardia sp. NPDC059091]|uniref:undecaprenyl-diphosphate phosphatase n=1 Tax=unclassified Nocardia TaxID=2637762 RepID=UPI00369DC092